MATDFPNLTLGTAGHIDHGKTALIKFLTGCDTDRLKAEKERGMTIDLGYAPCTLGDRLVGIVDVPGHEGFIKTMVAGASGMDGVIFVVAADDGVMPQTREHLDILTLLGVRHGIVALTKIDRVDPELREIVQEDLEQFLEGTFLAGAPVLPVDNLTGAGFMDFHAALSALVDRIEPRQTDGVFRLPVDRAFSAKGAGTIVAGVPVAGRLAVGDPVVLLPGDVTGRVRAIQVYGEAGEEALSGQCAAINVPQFDVGSVSRGDVVATPGYFESCEWLMCQLTVLPTTGAPLTNGERVRVHIGTADAKGAVYLMEHTVPHSGEPSLVQIHVDESVIAAPGDRFIIRSLSPAATVGGGVVLDVLSKRLRRSRVDHDVFQELATVVDSPTGLALHVLASAPDMVVDVGSISRSLNIPFAAGRRLIGDLVAGTDAVSLGSDRVIHPRVLEAAWETLSACLAEYHGREPASPGMLRADALKATAWSKSAFDLLCAFFGGDGRLITAEAGRVGLADHVACFSEEDREASERVEKLYSLALFAPPNREDACRLCELSEGEFERLSRLMCERGTLVRVSPKLLFHTDAVAEARSRLEAHIGENGKLESVDFKYALETTRKYAIPLLDYFDRTGLTTRSGNTRFLRYRASSGTG
ncbi:MAG: selenocysteine-specific translation elongation factor [Lentisphaerae bacterium]|jgi:selenocysteine-specific elongation factor|nr:selenocysteine-specific translation elongation factor [Lentisphaerota bacterium]MBT5612846.1 selenocysteine-specific translation elongation factor [Lentisphaerota bacterium]MBT7059692.1 selenocysteine-specific translation elongation factor [Lentisphaerota bacterium]MBT7841583.1 selenocysteine-specific translation elongation factor [Lentisphaerota bacterium]